MLIDVFIYKKIIKSGLKLNYNLDINLINIIKTETLKLVIYRVKNKNH